MNKPIMCPLCNKRPAGPAHRMNACSECHKEFVDDQNQRIERKAIQDSTPSAINYFGGGTYGPGDWAIKKLN